MFARFLGPPPPESPARRFQRLERRRRFGRFSLRPLIGVYRTRIHLPARLLNVVRRWGELRTVSLLLVEDARRPGVCDALAMAIVEGEATAMTSALHFVSLCDLCKGSQEHVKSFSVDHLTTEKKGQGLVDVIFGGYQGALNMVGYIVYCFIAELSLVRFLGFTADGHNAR